MNLSIIFMIKGNMVSVKVGKIVAKSSKQNLAFQLRRQLISVDSRLFLKSYLL